MMQWPPLKRQPRSAILARRAFSLESGQAARNAARTPAPRPKSLRPPDRLQADPCCLRLRALVAQYLGKQIVGAALFQEELEE